MSATIKDSSSCAVKHSQLTSQADPLDTHTGSTTQAGREKSKQPALESTQAISSCGSEGQRDTVTSINLLHAVHIDAPAQNITNEGL